jgi:hypothetical protein
MQTATTNNTFRSNRNARLRSIVVVAVAMAMAGLLFHKSYRMLIGLNFPELPFETAAAPLYKEEISPDRSLRVRLIGGKNARVQLILLPNHAIDQKEINNYVVLDANWDAEVYCVWKTPEDLVVYCAKCTPIRVARARTQLGNLRIEYKFPSPTFDESTAVIEMSPNLPADEQKAYEKKVRKIREELPYRSDEK